MAITSDCRCSFCGFEVLHTGGKCTNPGCPDKEYGITAWQELYDKSIKDNTALKDALREAVSKLNHLINKSNRVTAKGRSTIADSINYNSDINMLYGAQCEAEAFIKKTEGLLK